MVHSGMSKNQLKRITLITWILNLLLVLLVTLTPLAVNPYRIIYWQIGFLIVGLPLLNWLTKRTYNSGILTLGIVLVSFVSIGYFSTYYDWRGSWKTQTIKYENLHLKNRTIEFQMQDKGSLGYNRRTVDRIRLLPFIEWTTETSTSELDTLTWKLVNENVNELGLKAP